MKHSFFTAAVLLCPSFVHLKEMFKSCFVSSGTSEAETGSIPLLFLGLSVAWFDSLGMYLMQ